MLEIDSNKGFITILYIIPIILFSSLFSMMITLNNSCNHIEKKIVNTYITFSIIGIVISSIRIYFSSTYYNINLFDYIIMPLLLTLFIINLILLNRIKNNPDDICKHPEKRNQSPNIEYQLSFTLYSIGYMLLIILLYLFYIYVIKK